MALDKILIKAADKILARLGRDFVVEMDGKTYQLRGVIDRDGSNAGKEPGVFEARFQISFKKGELPVPSIDQEIVVNGKLYDVADYEKLFPWLDLKLERNVSYME